MAAVLDTSGILRSDLNFSDGNYLITNSVLEEIRDEMVRTALNSAIRYGNIRIMDPDKDSVKMVETVAEETGYRGELSHADIDVIALALEKRATIVSDDYSIQNVASILKLRYRGIVQDGIKRELRLVKVCEACNREYTEEEFCSVCGSRLRKVAKPI